VIETATNRFFRQETHCSGLNRKNEAKYSGGTVAIFKSDPDAFSGIGVFV